MKLRLAVAATGAAAMAAAAAHAAPVSANANANATVVAPNQVTATRTLEFGSIARPTTGSTTVTVASAATGTATPSVSGGNGFIPTAGQARAATFRITGTAGQTYSITNNALSFTAGAGNLSNVGAENPMSNAGSLNTIPGTALDDLFIGGHFDISPTTALQVYTGTLALTVNFN